LISFMSFDNGLKRKKSAFAPKNYEPSLFPVELGGKLGYINRSGKIVIEPQFDWAEDFHMGLAAVEVGGKWGYINKIGKMVIEPQFDWPMISPRD